MLIPEEKLYLKNKILIGLSNFPKEELSNLKAWGNLNIFNLEYININKQRLETRINILKEKALNKNKGCGMISSNWLNKYKNEIPCLIIQMIDITYKILDNRDPFLISEDIMRELGKIKSAYMDSNYILIIKNLNKSNFETQIKNNIVSNMKFIKDKHIFIINDSNKFEDQNFVIGLSNIIKEEINKFFCDKKTNKLNKYDKSKEKKEIELCIKYLLKLFSLSVITHKDKINFTYLFKAKFNLNHKLDKSNYSFISNSKTSDTDNKKDKLLKQIITYIELKNIGDYINYYLISKQHLVEKEKDKIVYNHLILYDINNFINLKEISTNDTNNNEIDFELYYKYLSLFDCIWKLSWYMNKEILDNNNNNNIEKNNKQIIISPNYNNFFLLVNILKLYNFLNKEKDFIEKNIINKYKDYKYKQENNKFLEKIPTYYEIDENDKIIKELTLEESIFLFMNNAIVSSKFIFDIQMLYKKLQYFFTSQKFFLYLFNYMIKYNLLEYNNTYLNTIFIKNSIEYLNDNKMISFKKIYENYVEKLFNLFIKQNIFKEELDLQYKFEVIIKYLTIKKNVEFSDEEINKINNILNNEKINSFKIYNLNLSNNNFIDIKINYKKNNESNQCQDNCLTLKPFDYLNIEIILSLKKENIVLYVEKVQIFFNSEINSINNFNKNYVKRNFKEIKISNQISTKNKISFYFNHLIKSTFNNYFLINNIEVFLKNKNIININNNRIKNIILYERNNLEQGIIKIINDNKIALKIGLKEYCLYSINYQKTIDNNDLIISEISGKIELLLKDEFKGEKNKEKKFYIRPLNIDNNIKENSKSIFFKENIPFFDNDLHKYKFLININEIGKYFLIYNMKFKLIHKECPNESYIFEDNKKVEIECIEPFEIEKKLETSLYTINITNNQIIYPKNYPIKCKIFIKNILDKKIIIKNINIENTTNYINLFSPYLNILSKKSKDIVLLPRDQLIIPIKLLINENIETPIGIIKIKWITDDSNEIKELNNSFNEKIIELDNIIVKEINYIIEGNFILEKNLKINNYLIYQLKIKNLDNYSKIINCNLFNENNSNNNKADNNRKYIINYGLGNIKDILLPKKELIFLFHLYDLNKIIKNDYNPKLIIDSKYSSLIKIDEYIKENDKEKEILTNQIFFIPELFTQINENY